MATADIKVIRTNKPVTHDRVYGLDVLSDLPWGAVVIDIVGQKWMVVSK